MKEIDTEYTGECFHWAWERERQRDGRGEIELKTGKI